MKLLKSPTRSATEYVVLSLSLATAIALSPFALHRLIARDWAIATLDSAVVIATFSIFIYVLKTRKTKIPCLVVAIIFLATEVFTTYLKGPSQVVWAYPATIGVYFLVNVWNAAILNLVCMMMLTALIGHELPSELLSSFIISLTSTNVFVLVFALRNLNQSKMLHELSYTDALTGVANRRAFDQMLSTLCSEVDIEDNSVSLIFFDIDHFKKINDDYGHVCGDQILRQMAEVVQTQLKHDTKLYRIGGEEYVIGPLYMHDTQAFQLAERLRKIIENSTFLEDTTVTVSMGVAGNIGSESAVNWQERADNALYQAKESGRNQSQLAPSPKESQA